MQELLTDDQALNSGHIALCSYGNLGLDFEARLDAVWCALLRCNTI